MNTEYVYLKFPEYADFFKFIKERNLSHEFGLLVRRLRGNLDDLFFFVRLTKRKEDEKLILLCDVEIYKGFRIQHNAEQFTKLKNDKIAEIKEEAKKILGEDVNIIDAEFKLDSSWSV